MVATGLRHQTNPLMPGDPMQGIRSYSKYYSRELEIQ